MAWAAQLHAVMQHHAWAAAVQTPGGAPGQFAAHEALLVALRAQQAGAARGGAAVASAPAAGSSANEASSFGPAVDQGHKSLAEMREERQVHPNMVCFGARILHPLLCLLQRILQPKTLTCMRTKYVSVLILHVLNVYVGVWSAGVEKTI